MLNDLTDQFKKGYKTTEFWGAKVALLIPAVGGVAKLLGYDVDTTTLGVTMTGLIPEVGYILSRGWVKKSRVEGVAEVLAYSNSGNTTPQPGAATVDDMPAPDSTLA